MIPELEAVNISPELVWFTMSEALLPIPPEIERGAGVVADPMNTAESKSDDRRRLPDPFGVIVIVLFKPLVIVLPEIDKLFCN